MNILPLKQYCYYFFVFGHLNYQSFLVTPCFHFYTFLTPHSNYLVRFVIVQSVYLINQ
nr:MAG TPA: hypothetical protein [Caudoviricetes sp.]